MQLEFHQLDRRWEHWRARCPDRQKRLLASLAANGQQIPIVVVAVAGQPDGYLVIDGYQRIEALEQLGRDTVEAVVWPSSESEAVLLEHAMRGSRRITALEEGWLLQELERRFGYCVEDLGRRFDRSPGWVSRRLALLELLPAEVQQRVRTGEITAHMAMKFLAPMSKISREDCQRMAEILARRKGSTREAGQLYAAWRDGSAAIRQRILNEPELFLKAQRQREPSPPTPSATALLGDLKTIVALAQRANRRLAGGTEMGMDGGQCEQARRQLARAIDDLSCLSLKLPREEEETHVESKSTHSDSGTAPSGSAPSRDRAAHGHLPGNGAPRPGVELHGRTGAESSGEGRALPAADPGSDAHLQGESGAGP
jgi:ParB family chromosome partitioning protein